MVDPLVRKAPLRKRADMSQLVYTPPRGRTLLEKSMRRLVVLVCLVMPIGCVSIKSQFDEAPLKWILASGEARVAGQAFTKTRGGETRTPREVLLVPMSDYTREVANRGLLVRNHILDPEVDPRLETYIRRALCDADGRFEFEDVPDGEYYITCGIFWEVSITGYLDTTGNTITLPLSVNPSTRSKCAKLILRP